MKVLTAAQMREVDRRTIELGIPSLVLMENAGHRVVEFLAETFRPLAAQRIVVICGKGNNGGDGFVIARQLHTRIPPKALWVVLAADPESLRGDAAENFRMLRACGCPVASGLRPEMRTASIVLDALLGTGLRGAPEPPFDRWIAEMNSEFPLAKIVAVDISSGMSSDDSASPGPVVRVDYTVTFTAPKAGQVQPPNCDLTGKLIVGPIGSPPELYDHVRLHLAGPQTFARLLAPRRPAAHKGDFGHALVWAGSEGKTGAAAMSGLAALRAGAGLVTVGSAPEALGAISSYTPELMTDAISSYESLANAARGKTVVALGPGLGSAPETVALVRRAFAEFDQPVVIDADGLNALAGSDFRAPAQPRILTPHPGEMSRLSGQPTASIQRDRLAAARAFAQDRGVVLVLKGQRTIVAMPDGNQWINPTGTPAMATAGSGDILTGLIAGLVSQFPAEPELAVLAAVWLHGRSGELAAAQLGEQPVIATDLLRYLPEAIHECARVPDAV